MYLPKNKKMHFMIVVIMSLVVAFAPGAVNYLRDYYDPASRWVVYEKIKPLNSKVKTAEFGITMLSYAHYKEPVYVVYNDVLHCDFGDKHWVQMGATVFPHFEQQADFTKKGVRWNLEVRMPRTPAKCFVRSNIRISPNYCPNCQKSVWHDSVVFEVVD